MRRIRQAEKTGALELGLSRFELNRLPPELARLTSFQSLDLSWCKLQELGPNFESLHRPGGHPPHAQTARPEVKLLKHPLRPGTGSPGDQAPGPRESAFSLLLGSWRTIAGYEAGCNPQRPGVRKCDGHRVRFVAHRLCLKSMSDSFSYPTHLPFDFKVATDPLNRRNLRFIPENHQIFL
jgi:hypothetical protein